MEGEGGAVSGFRGAGWGDGGRGDGFCAGVCGARGGVAGDGDGGGECGGECVGGVEVSLPWGFGGCLGVVADNVGSTVVLWVSQNMEDEYAYNLAL